MKDTVSHYVPPHSPLTSTEPQVFSNNLTMPVRAARRRSPRFGEPHRSRSLIAGVAVDWSPRRAIIVAVTMTVIVVLLLPAAR